MRTSGKRKRIPGGVEGSQEFLGGCIPCAKPDVTGDETLLSKRTKKLDGRACYVAAFNPKLQHPAMLKLQRFPDLTELQLVRCGGVGCRV